MASWTGDPESLAPLQRHSQRRQVQCARGRVRVTITGERGLALEQGDAGRVYGAAWEIETNRTGTIRVKGWNLTRQEA